MEYLSKERYDEIVAEVDYLINEEYPRIKEALAEARAQGDLSENFEYRAARRAQGKAISRIRFLQRVLQFSRVIDTKALPKDQISLLSKVEFTNLSTNVKMTYTIVSPHEMNLQEGKISCKSPIGMALMGKKVGDVVDVNAPSGFFQLRIASVLVGQEHHLGRRLSFTRCCRVCCRLVNLLSDEDCSILFSERAYRPGFFRNN